jgi:hypothetical protein
MSSSGAACAYEYESDFEVPDGGTKCDQPADNRVDDSLRTEITRAEKLVGTLDSEEESLAYSRETLNLAIVFLRVQSSQFRKMYSFCPPVPQIGPGPNGSVDLHWKQDNWELLINIPSDKSEQASFYGDDYGTQRIRGTLHPRKINYGIIAWLTHR